MTYPIETTRALYRDESSRYKKEYQITVLTNSDGKGLIIRRYGKKSNLVNMVVETYATRVETLRRFSKLCTERENKDYRLVHQEDVTITLPVGLGTTLGPIVFQKLGAAEINHLDPTFDTTGLRQTALPAQYDDDGNRIEAPKSAAFTREQLEAAEQEKIAAEVAAKNAKYASHPLYGRF